MAGPLRRRLQRAGDVLVRFRDGRAEVPRASIGVEIRVEDLGENRVGAPPIGRRRGVVDGRSHERVAELDLRGEGDEPARLGVRDRVVPRHAAKGLRGAPKEHRIAQPFGRGDE